MKRTKKLFKKLRCKDIMLYTSCYDYRDNHIIFETLKIKDCDNSLLKDK